MLRCPGILHSCILLPPVSREIQTTPYLHNNFLARFPQVASLVNTSISCPALTSGEFSAPLEAMILEQRILSGNEAGASGFTPRQMLAGEHGSRAEQREAAWEQQ